jgi:hypothetical protein
MSVWQVGSTVSGRREREGIPIRVLTPGGPWAVSPAGPDWFPGPFSIFIFFSFSVFFLFPSYYLQFDSNQAKPLS